MTFFAISITCFSIFVNIFYTLNFISFIRCETYTATPDTSDYSTENFQEMMPYCVGKLVPPPSFSDFSDDKSENHL